MATNEGINKKLKNISKDHHLNKLSGAELALAKGNWVKLICGASNQDIPSITDLCAVYAAAGVHCIDVSADVAVVKAAREGICWADKRLGKNPWLMISISDGKDIHFRKAIFDPQKCPQNCPRPCERICPVDAIQKEGIDPSRCYGCGRCLPICPIGIIHEEDTRLALKDLAPMISQIRPDAVEIHTTLGRNDAFKNTLNAITKANVFLKRVGVSCGLEGYEVSPEDLAKELWQRHSCLQKHGFKPLWQLDGRPMSGDIGIGTARVAVSLWEKIRPIAPPGPLQLAGGTNSHTITHLRTDHGPEGIAFGGMARSLIQPFLQEAQAKKTNLRDWPEGWDAAVKQAKQLINPWLTRTYL